MPIDDVEWSGPEWEAWYFHSKTQVFLKSLKDSVEKDMWQWINGAFANPDNPASSAVMDAEARGNVKNSQRIIDMIEGIIKDDDNEQPEQ